MAGHELSSAMLFIHPPLAFAGYVLTYIFTFLLFRRTERRMLDFFGAAAWLLTFLGLVTGMIWAQAAWGSYWSWDPKETTALVLFFTLSFSLVAAIERYARTARALALLACLMTAVTASTSWLVQGLHSFGI